MLMESQVKLCSPQNISGTSQCPSVLLNKSSSRGLHKMAPHGSSGVFQVSQIPNWFRKYVNNLLTSQSGISGLRGTWITPHELHGAILCWYCCFSPQRWLCKNCGQEPPWRHPRVSERPEWSSQWSALVVTIWAAADPTWMIKYGQRWRRSESSLLTQADKLSVFTHKDVRIWPRVTRWQRRCSEDKSTSLIPKVKKKTNSVIPSTPHRFAPELASSSSRLPVCAC